MLPVVLQNEPINFDSEVRQPGLIFLLQKPNPTDKEWRGKEYWQKSLPDLRRDNNKICAYSATWIPHSTGSHSIDHFVSKKITPNLAYEWSNFRYVSARFNSRKGLKKIVDPHTMTFNWFIIDFGTFFIQPNSSLLEPGQLTLAYDTIKILKLNEDEELVNERLEFFMAYKKRDINFAYLHKVAPFLAGEMKRQKLL